MTYTTLRDQLAMAALPAIISEHPDAPIYENCHVAYSYADAMLETRDQEEEPCVKKPLTEKEIDRMLEREG